MKLISYNVNGVRSALSKGLHNWLGDNNFDVVCLQEVKATYDQIDPTYFAELGYETFWCSAMKKGYSGVAILSKVKPANVHIGLGIKTSDQEGRVLRIDFEEFSILNVYVPSGSAGELRQEFKMQWLADFHSYITLLKKTLPNLIICGDFNICHKPIDIHNPVANKNSSGFLPEEREWFSNFLDIGFVDAFRQCCSEPHRYSWWSYRANARMKNLGWRLDYHLVSEEMNHKIKSANIFHDVIHSDHCPVFLEIH